MSSIINHFSQIQENLTTWNNIVIICHRNPDGDAIGSSLGLMHYLAAKGKNAQVVVPNDYAQFFDWMPGTDQVLTFTQQKELSRKAIEAADVVFCLDFNGVSRVGELEEDLRLVQSPIVVMDHHLDPTDFGQFYYTDDKASSTAEMVFRYIAEANETDLLTVEAAQCLYTGLMTDTGSFKFGSTSPAVHIMAAKMLEIGVNPYDIHDKVINSFSENRMKLFGHVTSNQTKIYAKHKAALSYVTVRDNGVYEVKKGDTEGLVNMPMQISDVRIAVLFIEQPEMIKVSLRSKGAFDVNQIARRYFNGGGHANASGGKLEIPLAAAIELFERVLEENADLQR